MRITTYVALLFLSISMAFSQNAKEQFMFAVNEGNFELAETHISAALSENPKDIDLHLLAGDIFIELGKFNKAVETYRLAEKISRKPNVMRKLAGGLSMAGDFPEAVKMLRKLTVDEKKEAENWIALANVYVLADSIGQAELAIARAREIDKNNVQAYVILGDLYFKQRVYELSKDNYEEALRLNPDLNDARMKLAQSYYWLGTREQESSPDLANEYFTRSLQEWNTLTQKDPKNSKAWFEQGKIFFFSKNYIQAAQSLNNFVQLRPGGSLGRWYLAQSLYELGRCDSARTHLRIVAQEIDTASQSAKLLLARCYMSEGDNADAALTYSELQSVKPLGMEDVRRWGQAALMAGDTNTAVEKWKQAIEMDPTANCQLMFVLGTSLNKMQRYDEAIEILSKRLNVAGCDDSTTFMIHYFIGLSEFFNGNSQAAIEPLVKASELNPGFLWSTIYLGDVYANLKNDAKAEQCFNSAVSTGTANAELYKNELNQAFFKLAGMKLDQKKYKDLEKIGRQWLEAMPDSEYAALFTAISYQGLGQNETACKYYRATLKINPDNKTAKENIKSLGCK